MKSPAIRGAATYAAKELEALHKMAAKPNTPAPRPDVEGIDARVKHGLEVGWRSRLWPDNTAYNLCTEDIPALIAYIGRLEEVVKAAQANPVNYQLARALAALGDGDG